MIPTKTVLLSEGPLGISLSRDSAGRPLVVDIDQSSDLYDKLSVGDIITEFKLNDSVTYSNLSVTDLIDKLNSTQKSPFRSLVVVETTGNGQASQLSTNVTATRKGNTKSTFINTSTFGDDYGGDYVGDYGGD